MKLRYLLSIFYALLLCSMPCSGHAAASSKRLISPKSINAIQKGGRSHKHRHHRHHHRRFCSDSDTSDCDFSHSRRRGCDCKRDRVRDCDCSEIVCVCKKEDKKPPISKKCVSGKIIIAPPDYENFARSGNPTSVTTESGCGDGFKFFSKTTLQKIDNKPVLCVDIKLNITEEELSEAKTVCIVDGLKARINDVEGARESAKFQSLVGPFIETKDGKTFIRIFVSGVLNANLPKRLIVPECVFFKACQCRSTRDCPKEECRR